ncbi:hypothetical protein HMN09_00227700 [Mycena chlorophos]|uniref:Uncharacterized protein n=1 Tax=Mycena chlorophos TaxID=658473 RepID=A0A8H6TKT5_MYCCL|nr:hypothetical protein HMN09_00227700 [Mycena chlorophos]
MSCLPTTAFNLYDFQGHVLDLANTVNPLISQTLNPSPTLNQQWSLALVNSGNYVLANGVSKPGQPVVVTWDTSAGTTSPLFMQAIAGETTGLAFAVNCVNDTSAYLVDGATGLALSAWGALPGSTKSPITLESFIESPAQAWTFHALD